MDFTERPHPPTGASEGSNFPASVGSRENSPKLTWHDHPVLHVMLLAALAAYCLWVSWRRWPDAIVDFGRELYIPWQLSEGAVLYRDVNDFYGPLSQYINAGVFKLFGPGLMVLVWVNLVVYAGILFTLYRLVRRAWTPKVGVAAVAFFVVGFSFARYTGTGSFNYATPYAHETTHGMLVIVVLIAALLRWLRHASIPMSAAVGLLGGLTLVLKPEFMVAAGVLMVVAVTMRIRLGSPCFVRSMLIMAAAAALPTVCFAGYFGRYFPAGEAWSAAARAWINLVGTGDYIRDPTHAVFAGFDFVFARLRQHAMMTGLAVCVLGGLVALGWLAGRAGLQRRTAIFAAVAAAMVGIAIYVLGDRGWRLVGRCFLPLLLTYLIYLVHRAWRTATFLESATQARLLLTIAAFALMARMVLNGRIHQFGYYQAAMAGVVLVAMLLGEFPAVASRTVAGRRVVSWCMVMLLFVGALHLWRVSRHAYAHLNVPIGEGLDRFYGPSDAGEFAGTIRFLQEQLRAESLLVLPEGLMPNYLARMKSPIVFYSILSDGSKEARLVEQLAADPPLWVMTVPRSLEEFGVARYGERTGAGKELVEWVEANYDDALSRRPAAVSLAGVQLLQRR